jgi:hypothetical protein
MSAGSGAVNSVAIDKITLNTPFKNVYVLIGAADKGTAVGWPTVKPTSTTKWATSFLIRSRTAGR